MNLQLSKTFIYGLLFFLMIIWGLNVVALKVLVASFPPATMTAVRIFLAGLTAFVFLIFQRNLRNLTKREWMYTIAAAVLGQFAHHFFLAMGLLETSASNSALILALVPLTTSILAVIFLNDRLTILRLLGIGLGFAGVSLVVLQANGGLGVVVKGDLYVFGAMITQALSLILIKKVTDTLDSKQMTAIMITMGSLFLFSLSFFIEPQGTIEMINAPAGIWVWLLFLFSVLATGLGHMLYNSAVHQIGPGQTTIFINLTPFFALLGSVIFLNESIYLSHILGFILIVIGVILGTGYLDDKLKSLGNGGQIQEHH